MKKCLSKGQIELKAKKVFNKKFDFIKELKQEFPKTEIFLVGGAVRDLILSRQTKDYDFVIRKINVNDLEKFLANHGSVNLVGQQFGVFKFVPENGDERDPFDLALPRKDFSLETGGYRDVEIQTNPNLPIEQDLSRRDFTINAIAIEISIKNGHVSIGKDKSASWRTKMEKSKIHELGYKLIDPFNGCQDLKKKLICAVGKPEDRFREDYSRMLRGVRLACQLDFKIEEKTWQALRDQMKFINKIDRRVETVSRGQIVESKMIEKRVVPYEVIAKEFLKAFVGNPVRAFDLYDQSGAFEGLIPEILAMKGCPQPPNYHTEGDVWQHTRLALEKLQSKSFKKYFGDESISNELLIATLFHDIGKPPTLQTPEKDGTDRIRFNEHDVTGARMAREIGQRLKLSSPDKIGLDTEKMAWLVKEHMVLIRGDISQMKPSTIEKYFFNPIFSGEDLLKISFADISATITKNGPLSFDKFDQMTKRIKELKGLGKNKKELPKPLLSGNDIIKRFRIKPSPQIGELLRILREEQLSGGIETKEQGFSFLEKYLQNRK